MSDQATAKGPSLAVALHYDYENAPRVVAKGRGHMAERILELAREHDVPVEDNQALAEMLATLDLDQEIPEQFYAVVAEVISFVLGLSSRKGRVRPSLPEPETG